MEQQQDQDYLVYPVIFLYRHHVELVLKSLLRRIPYLLDQELTDAEKQHLGHHRLDSLWQDLAPMLSAVASKAGWEPLPAADMEGVESYIRQLSELDPDSFAFRYAHSKKGAPSLPPERTHINLRHFAEMWEKLADCLDGLDAATSHLEEVTNKMRAEYRQEMARDEHY